MGCTPKGMRIPETDQFSYIPKFTYLGPPIEIEEPFMNIFTPLKSEREQYTWRDQWEKPHQRDSKPTTRTTPVRKENVPVSSNLTTQTEAAVLEMVKSFMGTQIHSLQTPADKTHRALEFANGAQPLQNPVSQISITQMNPAPTKVTVQEANRSAFETPQHYSTTYQTATKARRALDFSTGVQQVTQMGPLAWDIPTTTAQETAVRPKEREKEKERKKEKEREAQILQKAKHDKIKADLGQKIQTREQKMAEITSSEKAFKGGLDAEWLEINSVFSEVIKVVEDARQKALQPLEERRQRVKREAKDLVHMLQKEIDELEETIEELDENPDLQVPPLMSPNECGDWKNVTLDTSFSVGTLRTTTSNMTDLIQQKLEKLSSVELKRIPTFAVDVKLDPTSAHPFLALSRDGKSVRDGGKNQEVPDAPQRFDTFGSIMGLNRLTSGKSYWEVEVTNKTGWDLGVARRDAKRKGKLKLSPENGYWVTVHYEDDKYAALTAPPVSISLTEKPKKVGVFVDYEEGLVSFYDVTAQSHIYSFTECSFSDEISPYFSPHLRQNGKNAHPLIISAVKKQ